MRKILAIIVRLVLRLIEMRSISIIIPTYNSEKNIQKLIDILKTVPLRLKKEIIVVNDCSFDKTGEILKKIKGIKVITNRVNLGKGGALKAGLLQAKGELLFTQDDDLEYDPHDIPKVIKPILEGKTEIVFGSREQEYKKYKGFYNLGRIFLNKFISFLLGFEITDTITGSKAFTRNVLNAISPIISKGFDVETEIAAKAVKHGFIPVEVPISYRPRSEEEGKNIRWFHSLPIIFTTIKFRFLN